MLVRAEDPTLLKALTTLGPFLTKTEFKQRDEPAHESGVNLIEQFAFTKPQSNTITLQPTPGPPSGSPPTGTSPSGIPAPSIKGLTTNGRLSTLSSGASGVSSRTTNAPRAQSSSALSTRSFIAVSQDVMDSILKSGKPSTTAIKEVEADSS